MKLGRMGSLGMAGSEGMAKFKTLFDPVPIYIFPVVWPIPFTPAMLR
jgi:hypothetical protein